MIKTLIGIFILLSSTSYAQNYPGATPFDKFISKPSIEWAAYVNDKVRFEKDNLNKRLLKRLLRNEIKAALPVYYGINDADNITYLTKDSIDNIILYPSRLLPQYDSNGNAPGFNREDFRDHAYIDSLVYTDLTQILYIENGNLKSYIPWVAPMRPVRTSKGSYLGEGDYFSTCFNYKYKYQPRKKSKTVSLSEITRKIKVDSTGVINNIKQLYNHSVIETLWPYILSGKLDAFSMDTKLKLKKEEINEYLVNKTRIPVPVYDSTGEVRGFQLPLLDFSPGEFTEIELVQDWYYQHKDNIVFNKIREMILYAKKASAEEEKPLSIAVLKIVFN